MPSPLDEDEVEEILEAYADLNDIQKAADRVDRSTATVSKYVNEAADEGDPRFVSDPTSSSNEPKGEWAGVGPGESPFGEDAEEDPVRIYTGMEPGEFIKDFFSDFEVGIRQKWVEIQARRAKRRGKIPSLQMLRGDILQMNSGINKSSIQEAQYISEEYWAEAKKYLAQTGHGIMQTQGQTQPQQHTQPPHGTPPHAQGGQGTFVGPQQPQQPQGQNSPLHQTVRTLMDEVRDLKRELNSQPQQGQGGGDQGSTLQKLEELQREKEILEEISGSGEHIERLESQIQNIQTQVAQQGGGGAGPMPGGEQGMEERLLDLAATSENISAKEVLDVLRERQDAEENPDVLEKKFEKEIREMELEKESERYEKIGDTAETLAGTFGERFAEALTEGGSTDADAQAEEIEANTPENGETPQPNAPPTPSPSQPATAPPQTATQECKHCETEMMASVTGLYCPNCGFGVDNCDICSYPVEVPPIGQSGFGRCGACENVLDRPDDPEEAVECDDCGWDGQGGDLRGEILQCEDCGEYRPIVRQSDDSDTQDKVQELLEQ